MAADMQFLFAVRQTFRDQMARLASVKTVS